MNPMVSTSESKAGVESLLLPQVVYDRKGGRFYNKLESWWNRPSRLQQAAKELVYEDASLDEDIELDREIGLWEWLEERARRASILHQMLRRVEACTGNPSVRYTSEFGNVLSAKLAEEYLATLLKVIHYVDGDLVSQSTFTHKGEDDRAVEEILLVCSRQIFTRLRDARAGQVLDARQEGTPDCHQAWILEKDVERTLYALLDGFGEAKLDELVEEVSDSESEMFDDDVERAYEKLPEELKKGRTPPLPTPSRSVSDNDDTVASAHDSTSPLSLLLFNVISRINSDILDGSGQERDTGLRQAWMMVDVMESLRLGLWRRYDTISVQASSEQSSADSGRDGSSGGTFELYCEEPITWSAFNACLIETVLSLSIYVDQQRAKSGKSSRRIRTSVDPRDSNRAATYSPDSDPTGAKDRVLSMIDIETTYLDLLNAAIAFATATHRTARIHDMLLLLAGLYERYVEHQTSLWMELPAPKMKVEHFIDLTEVGTSMRHLVKLVMLRHEMTADDLASTGLERSLVYRWTY